MQGTTPENINEIKTLIHQIEQDLTHIRFNFHPLIIDENLIVQFSQDLLPCVSSHRMIKLTTYSYAVLASNTKHLLVHRDPNLCLLDRQLTIIKQTPWPLDISDICWSSTLDRFIVVNRKYVFTLDEKTMLLEHYLPLDSVNWKNVTCSDTRLFLSTEGTGSSIFEYTLMIFSTFYKEWKSPVTCTTDEWIEDLKFNNGFLGLIINCCTKNNSRLELRSLAMLQCLWSIQLEEVCSIYPIRCCPIIDNQWIVVACQKPRIFHISTDGKLIKIDKKCRSPSNICQFGNDLLAIWDQNCIYLQNLC
ncbi:unnamed protein product [Rotaria sordida]|uniref:Uncharacterized protein n=1 Tax=Rotaria sordida TaxID=392033 RepID=A0A814AI29_9BILA|nr:unnamed protein product [Rotaria sordida]